jgi:hypothetical protein
MLVVCSEQQADRLDNKNVLLPKYIINIATGGVGASMYMSSMLRLSFLFFH